MKTKYYEIVRLANTWLEIEEFDKVKEMVARKCYQKAIRFMSEWDYGAENINAARVNEGLRDTILDPVSNCDSILCTKGGYSLCHSACKSGLYEAFYLVAKTECED